MNLTQQINAFTMFIWTKQGFCYLPLVSCTLIDYVRVELGYINSCCQVPLGYPMSTVAVYGQWCLTEE